MRISRAPSQDLSRDLWLGCFRCKSHKLGLGTIAGIHGLGTSDAHLESSDSNLSRDRYLGCFGCESHELNLKTTVGTATWMLQIRDLGARSQNFGQDASDASPKILKLGSSARTYISKVLDAPKEENI